MVHNWTHKCFEVFSAFRNSHFSRLNWICGKSVVLWTGTDSTTAKRQLKPVQKGCPSDSWSLFRKAVQATAQVCSERLFKRQLKSVQKGCPSDCSSLLRKDVQATARVCLERLFKRLLKSVQKGCPSDCWSLLRKAVQATAEVCSERLSKRLLKTAQQGCTSDNWSLFRKVVLNSLLQLAAVRKAIIISSDKITDNSV
jgi:hypothetical protein